MNRDLLICIFLGTTFGAADDLVVESTLVDPVATLDLTVISATETAPPVIIREEVAQQLVLPSIVTKTIPDTPETRERIQLPSVDTISGAEIRTYQRRDLEDVLFQSAGVSLVQAGQAGGQTSLFVRGMESNHTVVLLNGRRLPPGLAGIYQLEYLDVSTLESVQFTRGASSSLYGSDAIAGALDLRSTDARFVQSNTLESYIEGGSFSTFRTGHQITLREGNVGVAIDAGHHQTANDRPFSDFENGFVRGNVAVEIADGVFFDLLGYVQDSTLQVPGSSLSFFFPEQQINQNRGVMLSPRFSILRDDWDFSVFYSYTDNELAATRDVFFNDNLLDQTGHEVEAIGNYRPYDGATFTIGGGFYEQAFERIPLIPGPFNPAAAFAFAYSSIFGQIEHELPAGFHFLGSARYDDHDSFESKGTYTLQLSKEFEATGTTIFGKTATGYKAPSGQDFIFLAPTIDPSTILPEESQTWEVGVRQQVINERSSLAFTYFQADIENLVDVNPFTFVDPAVVDTETSGVEVEFVYSPCENFEFYANTAWLDATIVDGFYLGGFGGAPGDRLPRRPTHTLSGGAVVSGDAWKLGAEISGAYDRFDAPGTFLDDYTVARFFGSVNVRENVELYARLENAFDLDYETTTGFEAAGLGAFGGVRIYLGGSPDSTGLSK